MNNFTKKRTIGPTSNFQKLATKRRLKSLNKIHPTKSKIKTLVNKRRSLNEMQSTKSIPTKSKFKTLMNKRRLKSLNEMQSSSMVQSDEAISTLFTVGFLGMQISYFKIPLANECLNSNFKSSLQDIIDRGVSSRSINLSSSKYLIVPKMFDTIITRFTRICCDELDWSISLRSRADPTVCGFTTQISALLFLSIMKSIEDHIDWFQRPLTEEHIQVLTDECNAYALSRRKLYIALQAGICNYASNTSGNNNPNSPLMLCSSRPLSFTQTIINVGVPYIYTFYHDDNGVITEHHFCVFKSESDSGNCIISDSWAGVGVRSNWTRIMDVRQFLEIMTFIDTTNDLDRQRTIINILFHVPYRQESQYQTEQTELYRVFYYELTPERIRQIEIQPIDLLGGKKSRSKK